jgi:dolichol-phosphate mannosyltransferase
MSSSAPLMQRELIDQPVGSMIVGQSLPSDGVDLSIVLPTNNESQNIVAVIRELTKALRTLDGVSYEILVVDDDSPDKTWELALQQASEDGLSHVNVMRRRGETGLATAVVRGWQASKGRIVGVMDADLQHPPEVIARLYAQIHAGATVALGSRAAEGGGVSEWSFGRRVISRTAQIIGLLILPEVLSRVSDPMSGCFLVRRSALAGIALNPTGYKILVEVLARARVTNISEVGYVFRERQLGNSKVSVRIYFEYLRQLLQLRITRLLGNSFARFCLVGSFGALLDMLVLYLLSDPSKLHWGLTRSKIIAAELAVVSNFLMNDAWTFASRIGSNRGLRHKFHRFLKFNILCGLGIILNVIILNILFNWLGTNRYIANAIAICLVSVSNYYLNLKLGWRTTAANDS